jgi:hypothetical protein
VYITQIIVPLRGVLYASKSCSTLDSTQLDISSKTFCQQFHYTVILRSVIFGQMDMTKLIGAVLQLYSADVPNNS